MNAATYLNCLEYNGLATGSVLGLYNMVSGSGAVIFYNHLYPSGYHFSGNAYNGLAVPLISVGRHNIANQQFSGTNCYRIGFNQSGDFSVLLDIEYSGCSRNTTGIAYTLFSTSDNLTGSTGTFSIGIDESNQLFFQTSGYYKTLNYELKNKNIVYVGLGNRQYVNFGVWDVLHQEFNSEEFTLTNLQNSVNNLYIGNFLNNTNTSYTGYYGKILNAVLLDTVLESEKLSYCGNCLFASGYTTGATQIETGYLLSVTGYVLSGITESVITGYTPYSGIITKADNSTINIVFPSGLSQNQTTQQVATVLTGYSTFIITGEPTRTYVNNESDINGFLVYDVEFDSSLVSGDTLEIYSFLNYNPNVNLSVEGLVYPTGRVQLIGNGLVETYGVDYYVDRELISGFFEDDILMYDILNANTYVSAYSGYWQRDKIQMSGGGYFPSESQFIEKSGKIYITGITGNALSYSSDVYMNGQKIISGYNYIMFPSGELVIMEINPTGLPALYAEMIYPSTGGLPTGVGEVQDAELSIIPNYGRFNRYYYDISDVEKFYFNNITGYSPQIWVNGVRQREKADYVKVFSCTLNSGFSDYPSVPFNFYDNEDENFNII